MNLRLTKNTIMGNAMGTPVSGMTRSAFGGASPVAGLYSISPPVSDPIFGVYAILTPVAGPSPAGGAQAAVRHCVAVAQNIIICRTAPFEAATVGGSRGGSVAWSGDTGKMVQAQQASTAGPLYVLSDRPIPGRNCIIVSQGFADVISALKAAGGGQIIIA